MIAQEMKVHLSFHGASQRGGEVSDPRACLGDKKAQKDFLNQAVT